MSPPPTSPVEVLSSPDGTLSPLAKFGDDNSVMPAMRDRYGFDPNVVVRFDPINVRGALQLTESEAKIFDRTTAELVSFGPKVEKLTIQYSDSAAGWIPSINVVHPMVTLLVSDPETGASFVKEARNAIPSEWDVTVRAAATSRKHLVQLLYEAQNTLDGTEVTSSFSTLFAALETYGFQVVEVIRPFRESYIVISLKRSTFDETRDTATLRSIMAKFPQLRDFVRFVAGDKPATAQATWDTRMIDGYWVRGGKQINNGGCTSGPTLRTTSGPPRQFVMTAGHCKFVGTVNIAGQPGTALPNTNCFECAGHPDVDVLLIETAWNTSYHFIWQAPGAYTCSYSCVANQGQTYLDVQLGVNDGWWLGPCLEGGSNYKFLSPHWMHDQRTVCGLNYGENGYGMSTHIYDYGVVCRGDSGGLVRVPAGSGGSHVSGVLSAAGGASSPATIVNNIPSCRQRAIGSSDPAIFYYKRISSNLAYASSQLGVNLEVMHP
jgi:hypothetical protein